MGKEKSEIQQLLDLTIENELIERDLIIAAHFREGQTSALREKLSNGLCKAANLARKIRGLPSIREENRRNREQETLDHTELYR